MVCIKCGLEIPPESAYCLHCGAKQGMQKPRRPVKKRGNGQGSVYKLPNGKYRAVVTLGYYHVDGIMKRRTTSTTFVKKSDAIAALPAMKLVKAKQADASLHELNRIYLAGKDYNALSQSQQNKLSYAWKRLSPIHFRKISSLTVDDLQNAVDSAASTYYPARDMKVMLSHLYQIAIRKEMITLNKSEYIELPSAPKAKRECWTKDDMAAFWADYEANPFTGYILIMCYAGLRYGELATIRIENIHLEENYMIGGIKTEAGIDREIPIHSKIKPIIKALLVDRQKKLLEMNEDNFYAQYWQTIDRLQLRHLPPQTCRHYYFSSMTAAGIQAGIIAETGGHASFLTTMKNYVRIPLEDKLKAVETIE